MNKVRKSRLQRPYRGYRWDDNHHAWKAYVTIKGKRFRLGYFDNENDARAAHDDALDDLSNVPGIE